MAEGKSGITLRDYQEEAIDKVIEYWADWDSKRHSTQSSPPPCLLQLATGAGKSIIIADLVKRINLPTLVLQPTAEILQQNKEKLELAGVKNVHVCSASAGDWMIGGITLATIGTIAKHWQYCQHFKFIIIDEADCVVCEDAKSQYLKFFNNLSPTTRIMGTTATPWRNQTFSQMYEDPQVFCRPLTRIHCKNAGGTRFGDWFWKGGIVYKCGIEDLQKRGFLAPTNYMIANTDWSFLRNHPGRVDFDTNEMSPWADIERNTSRFTQAVSWCGEHGLKTIVFSPNIETNFKLAAVIKSLGFKVETMDSNNDKRATRLDKMERFRSGDYQFLVNVGMVGRGVDVPSVDAVVLARPTKSLSLYTQFVGRCLRPDPANPDKVAQIIDLSGNVERFGRVEGVKLGKLDRVSRSGNMFQVDCITVTDLQGKKRIWDKVS